MPKQSADLLLVPTSLQRRVGTLGHGLHRFSEAWGLLATRLERGLLDEATTAWIRHWCSDDLSKPLPLPMDSGLAATIVWTGKSWQVAGVAGEVAGPWATALMLLHLPALRGFWARALRAQRFGRLTKVLPRVWALDMQELRPGAVIAGVGLTSWQDLPHVMATGRAFEILAPGGVQPVDARAWPEILASAKGRVLLRELPAAEPEGRLRATWKRDEAGRMVLEHMNVG